MTNKEFWNRFFDPTLKKVILSFASLFNNIVSGLELHLEKTAE